MAYPTICQPCRDGRHDECEKQENEPASRTREHELIEGGWFCVCAHGGEENPFQRRVREKLEEDAS